MRTADRASSMVARHSRRAIRAVGASTPSAAGRSNGPVMTRAPSAGRREAEPVGSRRCEVDRVRSVADADPSRADPEHTGARHPVRSFCPKERPLRRGDTRPRAGPFSPRPDPGSLGSRYSGGTAHRPNTSNRPTGLPWRDGDPHRDATRWGPSRSPTTATGARRPSAASSTSTSGDDTLRVGAPRHPRARPAEEGRRPANADLGLVPEEIARAVVQAADEVATGRPRRPLPARRLPDRLGHPEQHERQRGHRQPRDRGPRRRRSAARTRSTPTTTSTAASRATTPSRPRSTSPWCSSCAERLHPAVDALTAALDAKAAELRRHRQGRAHPPAGRDAGDPRPGDRRLGGPAPRRPGRRPLRRREGAGARHRGDRRRHRAQRPGRVRAARRPPPHRRDGPAVPAGRQPLRPARLARRARRRQLGAAHPRRRPDEARQRRALARLGPAHRHRRAADPRERAGQLDHAGQGQPDPVRGDDDGRHPRLRQRRDGGLRRQPGQLPAQRLHAR